MLLSRAKQMFLGGTGGPRASGSDEPAVQVTKGLVLFRVLRAIARLCAWLCAWILYPRPVPLSERRVEVRLLSGRRAGDFFRRFGRCAVATALELGAQSTRSEPTPGTRSQHLFASQVPVRRSRAPPTAPARSPISPASPPTPRAGCRQLLCRLLPHEVRAQRPRAARTWHMHTYVSRAAVTPCCSCRHATPGHRPRSPSTHPPTLVSLPQVLSCRRHRAPTAPPRAGRGPLRGANSRCWSPRVLAAGERAAA